GYIQREPTQYFDSGGKVSGRGTSTSDSIPARLSNGEYVIRAKAVSKYGAGFFEALNRMMLDPGSFDLSKFANLRLTRPARRRFNTGGAVTDGMGGNSNEVVVTPQSIQVINAIDSAEMLKTGLDTPEGTRTLVNVMKSNKETIRAILTS
ncbi:MAG: hypothetical protein OEX12_13270, partial [Gammaproteobacteria bacterium]|nr:hypothetical protein [Gammaproteobacteria bacterium]